MKIHVLLLAGVATLLMATSALAQQHWTRHWMQDYAKEQACKLDLKLELYKQELTASSNCWPGDDEVLRIPNRKGDPTCKFRIMSIERQDEVAYLVHGVGCDGLRTFLFRMDRDRVLSIFNTENF
jgi:hypothetical protein